jgi:hypothetical protein
VPEYFDRCALALVGAAATTPRAIVSALELPSARAGRMALMSGTRASLPGCYSSTSEIPSETRSTSSMRLPSERGCPLTE